MPQIVISHRRLDSPTITARIFDRLVAQCGEASVFMEVDLHHGVNHRDRMNEVLSRSSVLLVIIGRAWLSENRIANEDDPVRIEIETALQKHILVIPVLIDDAEMPHRNELPPNLSRLAHLNAISVRSGPEFDLDMNLLALLLDIVGSQSHLSEASDIFASGRMESIERPRASRGETERTDLPRPKASQDAMLAPPFRELVEHARAGPPITEELSPAITEEYSIGRPPKDAVEFAVSHPSAMSPGIPFLVDAWTFLPAHRDLAFKRARELAGGDAPFRSGPSALVARGTELKIELVVGPWTVEPEFQTVIWTGNIANASFRIFPTAETPDHIVHGTCKISTGGFRIGSVPFELRLGGKSEASPQFIAGKAVRNAFASYASKDRRRVLARVQGMQKFVHIFMDVRDLESGARYPTRLLDEIKASDVLYLFWSRHAKRSEWVDREWRYGLQLHGIDFIDPVPLVDPRKVPPPRELADTKHFNDWTLAWTEYDKSLSLWHRFRAWCAGE